ncbi:hypothetical protein BJY01DRAFT_228213 [Aspergillus pseudoustus]|uniref:F-box domain-containing protein n=1 Tax=Aspergillus pseudoustus TaxID=1810923 RepID=A0ABR4IM55_9EURO
MVHLPAELIHQIVGYIQISHPREEEYGWSRSVPPNTSLAPYATVSRQWQAVVESIVWQRVTLSKWGSLEQLRQLTSKDDPDRSVRIRYIRELGWADCMVDWSDVNEKTSWGRDETLCAQLFPEWYDRAFYRSLSDLFQLLDEWKEQKTASSMELSLWLDGGDLLPCKNNADAIVDRSECASLNVPALWRRFQIPYQAQLAREDIAALPIIPYITSVTLPNIDSCEIGPSAFLGLLSRFPRLRHVSGGEGRSIPRAALRALADRRRELTNHLSLAPESVETFKYEVDDLREMSWNPLHDAANYLSPHGVDELSIAFRSLSTRLRKLYLASVRISSSLFWPAPGETDSDATALHWPKMEEMLILDVPPYTADGKWILDTDPGRWCAYDLEADPDQDWEYDLTPYGQRGIIKAAEADKLYEAMGHAARRMPRLRRLHFTLRAEDGEEGLTELLEFDRDLTSGKAWLGIESDSDTYTPGEEVRAAWGVPGNSANRFEWHCVEFDQWP